MYHCTHVRKAKILKNNTIVWWGCGATGTVMHCPRGCKTIQEFWKTLLSYKLKHKSILKPHNFTPRYLSKIKENIYPQKDLYKNIHSSFIHNQHKLEAAQMSINSKMDKQKLWKNVTTWMNLKNTILSERSQRQKSILCMIPLSWNLRTRKTNIWQ